MMSTPLKKILLPTDFSAEASQALAVAAELSRKNGSKLYIIHVIEKSVPQQTVTDDIAGAFKEVHHKGNLRSVLDRWSVKLNEKFGIEVQTEVIEGEAYKSICEYAEKENVDLIVMGTHGHSGFKEFSIGNIAYNVIKNASGSVLTIPGNFSSLEFRNILFPVRPVNGIWEKFEALEPLMAGENNFLHIAEFCSDLDSLDISEKTAEIEKIMHHSKRNNIYFFQEKYFPGNTAETVLNLSKKLHTDLIAINANTVKKQNTSFADPYTRQIVNHANVPVLSFHC